jgi:mRNA-degrading endonuclease toxin of MazEF toxin-antitoxin module
MKPGDIWIVHIPRLGTHEQSGTRPAVIVARVATTIVTVIPCTSNQAALRFPFTHAIEPSARNGLNGPTVALTSHLRALDARLLEKKIGTLDKKTFSEVRAQARRLIG